MMSERKGNRSVSQDTSYDPADRFAPTAPQSDQPAQGEPDSPIMQMNARELARRIIYLIEIGYKRSIRSAVKETQVTVMLEEFAKSLLATPASQPSAPEQQPRYSKETLKEALKQAEEGEPATSTPAQPSEWAIYGGEERYDGPRGKLVQTSKPPSAAGADHYASYANHCAIQKRVPMTFHTWKRKGEPKQ